MDGFAIARIISEFMFGYAALIAIINPFGLAFVFLDRTMGLSESERAMIARRVAFYGFIVVVASLFAGTPILGFFGISLPALRIAGGLVVASSGWAMLNEPAEEKQSGSASGANVEVVRRMAFFPLTIPLTTGPGSIAAAVALAANRDTELRGFLLSSVASVLVAAAVAVTILYTYSRAALMARRLGPDGTLIVTRLSAFILLCVGVQIMLTGLVDTIRPLLAGGS